MICGHGSRSKSAEEEFGLLAKGLKNRFPETPVEYGFLEYSAPNIHMGLDALRNNGVEHIIAVPGMLFAATHAKNDIPSVLVTYQKKYPNLKISYGRELALHSEMIAAFESRILEAIYTILTTMALGFVLVYVVYISAKLTGVIDKIQKIKDPRR